MSDAWSSYISHVFEKKQYQIQSFVGSRRLGHSISHYLHGDFTQTRQLRQAICSLVYNNWTDCVQTLRMHQNIEYLQPSNYYGNMILGNGWATASDVKAASVFLHRKIYVRLKVSYQASFQPVFYLTSFGDEFYNKPSINLLLNNQQYQALQPIITSHITSQRRQESTPSFTAMCRT